MSVLFIHNQREEAGCELPIVSNNRVWAGVSVKVEIGGDSGCGVCRDVAQNRVCRNTAGIVIIHHFCPCHAVSFELQFSLIERGQVTQVVRQ